MQVFFDFIIRNRKYIIYEDEDINPLILLDYNDINKEITTIKNFINYFNGLNLDVIKQCKKYNLYENIFYVCDIEFFKEKFENFQADLYASINKQFNIIPNEYKKEFNKFYLQSFQYDNRTKLSSLMKLLRNVSDFLNLLNTFYIPKEKNIPLDPNSAAPTLFQLMNKFEEKEDESDEDCLYFGRAIKGDEINSFRFIIKKEQLNTNFNIICLDGSYGLKEYLKINPYCTILTSGTLAIRSVKNLLKTKFYKELNNDHVISNEQFMLNIITGYEFNGIRHDYSFVYNKRNDINQIKSLGNEIENLANSVVIGGVLVFFQSFEYLNKCFNIWLREGIIRKFNKIKETFFDIEFNKKNSEESIMEKKKRNNLLLFTVYRGKNSEGINFSDDEARMVICVGVPYSKLSDIKVRLKRDFLTERCKKERNGFDGRQWYEQDAMNAVNQSLGRLIRNVNDYGIMVCFGVEFLRVSQYFCKWIKSNGQNIIKLKENDKKFYEKLTNFLLNLREKYYYKNIINMNLINRRETIEDYSEENELNNENNDDNNSLESWENDNDEEKSDKENESSLVSIKKGNLKFQFPYLGNKRIRNDYNDIYDSYSSYDDDEEKFK